MDKFYRVPHGLHELSISKAEFLMLIALIKIRSDASREAGDFFIASNRLIAKFSKMDLKTVRRIQPRLKYKGLINYVFDYIGKQRQTRYHLLIPEDEEEAEPSLTIKLKAITKNYSQCS